MSNSDRATLADWAALVRLPNVFTVIADSTAGFLLAGGSVLLWQRHLVIALSVITLYWSGMVLNDLLDLPRDKLERGGRPIASGRVSVRSAQRMVGLLMMIGVGLAFFAGQIDTDLIPASLLPGCIAIMTAVAIGLYDGPLKFTFAGPMAMGLCRSGSLLLGASVATVPGAGPWFFSPVVGCAALAMGVYIAGITLAGRNEALAGGDRSLGPRLGFTLSVSGIILLATLSWFGNFDSSWRFDPRWSYPLLVGVMGTQVIYRGWIAMAEPDVRNLQTFVRTGILRIIPFSAAISALAAGPIAGLAVFALSFPALYLSRRFYVT